MPKSKKSESVNPTNKNLVKKDILSQVKWGESYTSLFLGIVVVVVAAVLVFSFLKGKNFNRFTGSQSTSTVSEQSNKQLPKTYTVKEGDDLWKISEKIYGSGYNWVDLASTNKLENPSVLFVGTKLSVPDVKVKEITKIESVTQKTNTITSKTYTVVSGDYLWDIAIRAYGDGYKWVEIAKVNNLANPNLIHPGNVLKLPR